MLLASFSIVVVTPGCKPSNNKTKNSESSLANTNTNALIIAPRANPLQLEKPQSTTQRGPRSTDHASHISHANHTSSRF